MVIITAPDKPGITPVDQAKIASTMKSAAAAAPPVLLPSAPTPGAVVKTTTRDNFGITEWELANGARAVPANDASGTENCSARRPGGCPSRRRGLHSPARPASSGWVVSRINAIDLRRRDARRRRQCQFPGFQAPARKDLETMFQLLYMRFTQPPSTAVAVQQRSQRCSRTSPPARAMRSGSIKAIRNASAGTADDAATIDQWNLEKSMAFYKDRRGRERLHLFFVLGPSGDHELLVESLHLPPSLHRKETWKDIGVHMPTTVVKRSVEKGIEPKSQVSITFSGTFEYNQSQRVAIRAMGEVLSTRLLETIREELGGTYSISASANYWKTPRPEYTVSVSFCCDPTRTDALIKRVFEEIEKYKTSGPTEKQLNDEKEALLKEYDANMKNKPTCWLRSRAAVRQPGDSEHSGTTATSRGGDPAGGEDVLNRGSRAGGDGAGEEIVSSEYLGKNAIPVFLLT
jgi:zinc protease